MTQDHKKKLSQSKLRYYQELKSAGLKRPYTFTRDTGVFRTKFPEVIEYIEKFNEIFRSNGKITEREINHIFKETDNE